MLCGQGQGQRALAFQRPADVEEGQADHGAGLVVVDRRSVLGCIIDQERSEVRTGSYGPSAKIIGRIFTDILFLPMSLNIKDPEADTLARKLAQATGETLTEAVTVAVKERLERLRAGRRPRRLADELDEIAVRCASLPVLDERPEDEILGYDAHGLPS
jgi:antitoxin VapB